MKPMPRPLVVNDEKAAYRNSRLQTTPTAQKI
jgi:hypothetical protein